MDKHLDRTSARNRPVNGHKLEKMLGRRAASFQSRQLQTSRRQVLTTIRKDQHLPIHDIAATRFSLTSHSWRAVTNPGTPRRRTGGKAKRKLAQRHEAERVTCQEMPFWSIAPRLSRLTTDTPHLDRPGSSAMPLEDRNVTNAFHMCRPVILHVGGGGAELESGGLVIRRSCEEEKTITGEIFSRELQSGVWSLLPGWVQGFGDKCRVSRLELGFSLRGTFLFGMADATVQP